MPPPPPAPQHLSSHWWRTLAQSGEAAKLPEGVDAAWDRAAGAVRGGLVRVGKYLRQAGRVIQIGEEVRDWSSDRLTAEAETLRGVLRTRRETRESVHRGFALVREAADRCIGLRAYPVQVAAGLAMWDGLIAEMATGEGKTLAATMPATLMGWRGRGCHIVTVNDYLAKRDAESMGEIYRLCTLRAGYVDGEMEAPDRRDAYASDVTYCTNKEAAADLLRDRLRLNAGRGGTSADLPRALLAKLMGRGAKPGAAEVGPEAVVMRGLEHALVDEADSVLVDEAVTPLIISGDAPNPEAGDAYAEAAVLAKDLRENEHYRIDHKHREITLTRAARGHLEERCHEAAGVFAGMRRREELVTQALTARDLFLRDKHYVIQEGKVVIVDEFTGRLMPDRTWRDGLHAAVEAKEGLDIQPPKATFASISFQRFFRRYRHLSGMTGTAWEARGELWQTYHTPTLRIPTHRPRIRVEHPDQIHPTLDAKWDAVVAEISLIHAIGRPVLVGTGSVEASEHLSTMLDERGLPHRVLNAVRHAEEAAVIADAGQPDAITLATNMAGRGTDIKLGPGVAHLGGLHVIATQRHETPRIDRQLFGRAGRQGDPGSAVTHVSLQDELLARHAPRRTRGLRSRLSHRHLFARAQRRAQAQARRQRRGVLQQDQWYAEHLGLAGAE